MRFKIDENLPVEVVETLQQAGHNAETVHSEKLTGTDDQHLSTVCQSENRVLITLDIGFADIRSYPPDKLPGIIVVRTKRQDEPYILGIIQRMVPAIEKEELTGKLWIVEEKRIRVRS
jgi:predicted nuclease of predicted toxin-antitoxin system